MGQSERERERERERICGCGTVPTGKQRPTFRRNVVPSTFGVMQPKKRLFSPVDRKDEGTAFLRNVGNELPIDTT